MADLEVENTLREIRERVLASAQRREPEAVAPVDPARPAAGDGAAAFAGTYACDALARMDANLSTTGRAWSRLPPMLSYRRGAAARLELWLKGLVRRAAHWFTWEQVNFNAAVHHALGDTRAALSAHEQALARLQTDILAALRAEAETDRARVSELLPRVSELLPRVSELQSRVSELQSRVSELQPRVAESQSRVAESQSRLAELQTRLSQAEARFEAGGAQLRQAYADGLERLAEAQRASAEGLRGEQHAEVAARAEELHAEMRERLDGLLEEQRVCFKQLSLEAGEAAVTYDRARRQLEARLEALENSSQ